MGMGWGVGGGRKAGGAMNGKKEVGFLGLIWKDGEEGWGDGGIIDEKKVGF